MLVYKINGSVKKSVYIMGWVKVNFVSWELSRFSEWKNSINCNLWVNSWILGFDDRVNFCPLLNKFICLSVMKTICPPSYHHNGFVATHAIEHLSTWCTLYDYWLYMYIYIYIYIYVCMFINLSIYIYT